MKPDCIQRNLLGEIVTRFERKGLRIIGLKMTQIEDALLQEHYAHHKDKDFFPSLAKYMKSAPVVLMAVAGINAVGASRLLVGDRKGYEAEAGTIRGDFSLSGTTNIVHASDSVENGISEVKRFFSDAEIFSYANLSFRSCILRLNLHKTCQVLEFIFQ